MKNGYADSTIGAAIWLICHAPDRLKAFLEKHDNPKLLEHTAREELADIRARRAKQAAKVEAQ